MNAEQIVKKFENVEATVTDEYKKIVDEFGYTTEPLLVTSDKVEYNVYIERDSINVAHWVPCGDTGSWVIDSIYNYDPNGVHTECVARARWNWRTDLASLKTVKANIGAEMRAYDKVKRVIDALREQSADVLDFFK